MGAAGAGGFGVGAGGVGVGAGAQLVMPQVIIETIISRANAIIIPLFTVLSSPYFRF